MYRHSLSAQIPQSGRQADPWMPTSFFLVSVGWSKLVPPISQRFDTRGARWPRGNGKDADITLLHGVETGESVVRLMRWWGEDCLNSSFDSGSSIGVLCRPGLAAPHSSMRRGLASVLPRRRESSPRLTASSPNREGEPVPDNAAFNLLCSSSQPLLRQLYLEQSFRFLSTTSI